MDEQMDLEKKPVKSKKLKIIHTTGGYFATFDGSRVWEIDPAVNYVLELCNGNNRIEDIAQEIARNIDMDVELIRHTLLGMLLELEKNGFIEYL
ncbi:MAG: PqqD family protein [Candidatus Aenigmatarchaeota archaeon]